MDDMMHRYVKKPENIRQIGESPYSEAIYIEESKPVIPGVSVHCSFSLICVVR